VKHIEGRSMKLDFKIVALCLTAAFASPVRADTTLIAVAANFAGAADALATAFKTETGHEASITTGSTGKLFAQIGEGAPFDVLLSADTKTPEKLEAAGSAVLNSRFTYALGGLTLFSADPTLVTSDVSEALSSEKLRFVAIANPDLAPYGVAAREVLTELGLWQTLQPKIVMGQNIGQVFAMAETGAADVAFVATSALHEADTADSGSHLEVPQNLFTAIRQDAVLLSIGAENPAALAFLAFLKTDKARKIISDYGYDLPE
jgi:molybdate transport system substrate-binding protein